MMSKANKYWRSLRAEALTTALLSYGMLDEWVSSTGGQYPIAINVDQAFGAHESRHLFRGDISCI
jgi:hypothetical protein